MKLQHLFSKPDYVKRFWKWFLAHEQALYHFEDHDQAVLFKKLHQRLQKIHPSLSFEFSAPLKTKKREFVISADGNPKAFGAVLQVTQAAPILPRWVVIAFRQPRAGFVSVDFGPVRLPFKDIYFNYAEERTVQKLNLHMKIRHYDGTDVMDSALQIVLDTLIGEFDTQTYLEVIKRQALHEHELPHLYPITALPLVVNEFKNRQGIIETWKLN
ncbi:MAG TPA: hypothetical protein PKD90_18185 [Phnomibacter sp.]|nr:hypothetical protein [Phnomibacter sp.]